MKFVDKFKSLFRNKPEENEQNDDNVQESVPESNENDCDEEWFIKITMSKNGTLNIEKSETLNEENCIEPLIASKETLKNEIIRLIGNDAYGSNLEQIDYELAMAYKEADYQIARADMIQAELDYYKATNNLNIEFSGPRLYALWNHYLDMKKRYEAFG